MDSDVLLRELRAPCGLTLTAELWKASAILAGLRVAANDPFRAADRDRGGAKNWLADVWGVIGELVALRRIAELTDARVKHCPIDFRRSVDDVDLRIACEDREVLLEAKAHLLQASKSWFMVNARAHARSRRRGAVGYVPILTAMGARRALVGGLLTTEQLDAWGVPDKRLKDPAIGVPLADLCCDQLHRTLREAEQLIEPGHHLTEQQIAEHAARAGAQLGQWRTRLPDLSALSAREVVAAVLVADRDISSGA